MFNLKLANQGKRNHHHHHHQMTKDDDHRNRNRKRTHTNLVFFSHFENYIWYITTVINLKLIQKIVWLCVCVCMLVNSVVVDGSYVFFFSKPITLLYNQAFFLNFFFLFFFCFDQGFVPARAKELCYAVFFFFFFVH